MQRFLQSNLLKRANHRLATRRDVFASALSWFVCLSILAIVPLETATAAGWKLSFLENFNGPALDRSVWATRYVYRNGTLDTLNDERQLYRDNDNHQLRDGALWLIAKQVREANTRFPYESGMIRSLQTFRYGYFEARVKLPKGKGAWAAYWLNSDYDENGKLAWPPEIDIFEYVINGSTEHPNMLHSNVLQRAEKVQDEWIHVDRNYNTRWTYYKGDANFNEDWQVVSLVWTPFAVHWYVNGKKLYSRKYRWLYNDGRLGAPAHVLLNLAVGGKWAGRDGIDAGAFPMTFGIDYVMVCAFDPGAASSERCGSTMVPEAAPFEAEFAPGPAR